jgi:hypothetical protein
MPLFIRSAPTEAVSRGLHDSTAVILKPVSAGRVLLRILVPEMFEEEMQIHNDFTIFCGLQ